MGEVGDLLRAARERAQLTQGELADLVGVHRASVVNWEKGTPPRNRLGKLRQVLGLDEHLKPLGTADTQDFRYMDHRELVARMNVLVSQLNSLAAEVGHRLQQLDGFDTDEQAGARQRNHPERATDGRFEMVLEDVELDPEGPGGEAYGDSSPN
ncbi:MAG: Helix-turn-helix domain [Streptosporangiaceae bacterium]|nr:Helix-turn-helix domain [Streptosporangiaceae bacterium]